MLIKLITYKVLQNFRLKPIQQNDCLPQQSNLFLTKYCVGYFAEYQMEM